MSRRLNSAPNGLGVGIVTILLAILAGMAVYFVSQPLQGGSDCDQDPQCEVLPPSDSGSYTAPGPITSFCIKTGQNLICFGQGTNNSGSELAHCWNVQVSGAEVTWSRQENSSTCQDPSHFQVWWEGSVPTPTNTKVPPPTQTGTPTKVHPDPTAPPTKPDVSATPSDTPVPGTPTEKASITPTATNPNPVPSVTPTPTASSTEPEPTVTPSVTPTPTDDSTATSTATGTQPTPTETGSPTPTPTASASATNSATPTVTTTLKPGETRLPPTQTSTPKSGETTVPGSTQLPPPSQPPQGATPPPPSGGFDNPYMGFVGLALIIGLPSLLVLFIISRRKVSN